MELKQINDVVQESKKFIDRQASYLCIRNRNRISDIKKFMCNVDMVSKFISPYTYIDLCDFLVTYVGGISDSSSFSIWEEAINMIPDLEYNYLRSGLAGKEESFDLRDLLKQVFASDMASRTPENTINRIKFLNHSLILNFKEIDRNTVLYKIAAINRSEIVLETLPELIDEKIGQSEKPADWDKIIKELIKKGDALPEESTDDYKGRLRSIVMVKTAAKEEK